MSEEGTKVRLRAPVRGMHCASCVAKVEGALRQVPGVLDASVNLATEQASVAFDPAKADFPGLQRAVTAVGYELVEPRPESPETIDHERLARAREQRGMRARFIAGALLCLPIVIGSMPQLFSWSPPWLRNPWLLFALATPVQFWVGWPFHRGFISDLHHRTASMATLVSIGTNAAYFFSLAVTLSSRTHSSLS